MFCSACGKSIPDDSAFCPDCGQKIVIASPEPPPSPEPPQPPEPPSPQGLLGNVETQQVSSGLNIGIIIGTLIFPLVGIVMGLIYLQDSNPNKKSTGKIWLWIGVGMAVIWGLASLGEGY